MNTHYVLAQNKILIFFGLLQSPRTSITHLVHFLCLFILKKFRFNLISDIWQFTNFVNFLRLFQIFFHIFSTCCTLSQFVADF